MFFQNSHKFGISVHAIKNTLLSGWAEPWVGSIGVRGFVNKFGLGVVGLGLGLRQEEWVGGLRSWIAKFDWELNHKPTMFFNRNTFRGLAPAKKTPCLNVEL